MARLDPRAKILVFLGLVIAVTFLKGVVPLLLASVAAWALLLGAGVGPRRWALVLLSAPAFTLAVAAPAALNVVTGGRTLVTLCRLGGGSWGPWTVPEYLTVTDAGLYVAARFLLRATACVLLASGLVASTRPDDLLRGFRALGVPSSFVMVGGMMVSYLGFLLRSAQEIHLAKLSRSFVPMGSGPEQAWAASSLGELYARSRRMAESVAMAMVSRGYRGEPVGLRPQRIKVRDVLFVLAGTGFAGALLWLG